MHFFLLLHGAVKNTSFPFFNWGFFYKLKSFRERGNVESVSVSLQIIYEVSQMIFILESQCDELLRVAGGVAGRGRSVWCLSVAAEGDHVHLQQTKRSRGTYRLSIYSFEQCVRLSICTVEQLLIAQ